MPGCRAAMMVALLIAGAGSGSTAGEGAVQALPVTRQTMRFEPFDWPAVARASPGAQGHFLDPRTFSPATPPRIAAVYRVADRTLGIALAGARGEDVQLLGGHEGREIYDIRWAPDGSALLYWAAPGDHVYGDFRAGGPTETSEVWVLLLDGSSQRRLIAQQARFAQWGRSTNEVLFWRQERRPEDRPAPAPASGSWQPYRATGPWEKPTVARAAPVWLPRPMDISPGGSLLAYVRVEDAEGKRPSAAVITYDLETHRQDRYPVPETNPPIMWPMTRDFRVLWSADGSSLVLSFSEQFIEWSNRHHWLLSRRTGQYVDLNARASPGLGSRDEADRVHIMHPAWLPSAGHRLLLYGALFDPPKERWGPEPERAWKWVVYDVDMDALGSVSGLGPAQRLGAHEMPALFSADGGYAMVHGLKDYTQSYFVVK